MAAHRRPSRPDESVRAVKTQSRVYSHCGLRIRTDIDLPLQVLGGTAWDVEIHMGKEVVASSGVPSGNVVARLGNDDDAWYTATSDQSGYQLKFKGCGEFAISRDLCEIVVRPDNSGPIELLPILLAGTVAAFVLALRGETVLHASAVSLDGSALAFVGHSGGGKSTLAALMCASGAGLVGDDVLTVHPGPPVTCAGSSNELRLRPPAASIVDAMDGATLRATTDERIAWAPGSGSGERLPLGAIVLPIPSRQAVDLEYRLLPPSDALLALLSVPRIHGWTLSDVLTRDFSNLSRLTNEVPVYETLIPWGPPFSSEIAPSLAGLLPGSKAVTPAPCGPPADVSAGT